jgi:hypothetical protein
MSDPLKPLFSGSGSALETLARKAAAAAGLTTTVQELLPAELRPHVLAAVRRSGCASSCRPRGSPSRAGCGCAWAADPDQDVAVAPPGQAVAAAT